MEAGAEIKNADHYFSTKKVMVGWKSVSSRKMERFVQNKKVS